MGLDRWSNEMEFHRLWLPDEDGWDVMEWGYDDDGDPPSLYSDQGHREIVPPD